MHDSSSKTLLSNTTFHRIRLLVETISKVRHFVDFIFKRGRPNVGLWDGLRYFIVALPDLPYNYFAEIFEIPYELWSVYSQMSCGPCMVPQGMLKRSTPLGRKKKSTKCRSLGWARGWAALFYCSTGWTYTTYCDLYSCKHHRNCLIEAGGSNE